MEMMLVTLTVFAGGQQLLEYVPLTPLVIKVTEKSIDHDILLDSLAGLRLWRTIF